MADSSTCRLTAPHPPKQASLRAFTALLPQVKRSLIHLRHEHDKHERESFSPTANLSDDELTSFAPEDLVEVRVGQVAYGIIEFGKVRIPSLDGAYIFVRWFVGGDDVDRDGQAETNEVEYKFHSFYTEDMADSHGKRKFRTIMGKEDELEFF